MSIFAFGLGYSAARVIARRRLGHTAGTTRKQETLEGWRSSGVEAFLFDGVNFDLRLTDALRRAELAVISIPPDEQGDPTLRLFSTAIAEASLSRLIYLSTVGVYGDAGGAWVDENSPTAAKSPRTQARVAAEGDWRALGTRAGVPVDILRLAGIYGPGRSAIDRLRDGTARRVSKPGQVFNRIHVDDIARAIECVVATGGPGDIYNVADSAPSQPEDVIDYAAQLLGVPAPPQEPFAQASLSEMSRSFYAENRRVRVDKLMSLGWRPTFPSYREGLETILADDIQANSQMAGRLG